MSIASNSSAGSWSLPRFPVRKFTVEEYCRLGATGVLTDEDRVELLEGLVVPKMNRNPPHDATVSLLQHGIAKWLPDDWHVRIQSAITTEDSLPEPDVAVVRGSPRDYVRSHPRSSQTALVVEVSDSSLARDREKARLFARAGIEQYWIVNLVDDVIEVYSRPLATEPNPAYQQRQVLDRSASVPLVIDAVEVARIAIADLLP